VADLVDDEEKKDDFVLGKTDGAGKPAPAADDKDKNKAGIPPARVEEMRARDKAKIEEGNAEIKRLTEIASRNAVTADIDAVRAKVDELDDKYEELLADGKMAEAKVVRKEMRRLQDVLTNTLVSVNARSASTQAVEQTRYDQALASVEQSHTVLNPDSDDFDAEVTEDVLARMQAFINKGVPRAEALNRAIDRVLKPGPKEDKGKGLRDAKAEEARRRGAAAAGKQPADLGKHGLDSDKGGDKTDSGIPSVLKMNQAQFAKLDEDTKAKLRGDDL